MYSNMYDESIVQSMELTFWCDLFKVNWSLNMFNVAEYIYS